MFRVGVRISRSRSRNSRCVLREWIAIRLRRAASRQAAENAAQRTRYRAGVGLQYDRERPVNDAATPGAVRIEYRTVAIHTVGRSETGELHDSTFIAIDTGSTRAARELWLQHKS